jgi:hypothetical protein
VLYLHVGKSKCRWLNTSIGVDWRFYSISQRLDCILHSSGRYFLWLNESNRVRAGLSGGMHHRRTNLWFVIALSTHLQRIRQYMISWSVSNEPVSPAQSKQKKKKKHVIFIILKRSDSKNTGQVRTFLMFSQPFRHAPRVHDGKKSLSQIQHFFRDI